VSETESNPTLSDAYLGARVTIHYNNSYTDQGAVTYLDNYWVELTKDNGERLLVPTTAIRLVKMMQPTRKPAESEMLLRPFEGAPQIEAKRGTDE
jgi:hypothetical protein